MPTRKSAMCYVLCTACSMKNIDACWYAIYLSATCKCCCARVCASRLVLFSCSCTMHMYSVLCTCESIRFRIQTSYHKRFSQNTKNESTRANPADVSVIWLRTLIQRVNIYLFQFNWIALINVSSAFIWWERIRKKTSIPHMRASTA